MDRRPNREAGPGGWRRCWAASWETCRLPSARLPPPEKSTPCEMTTARDVSAWIASPSRPSEGERCKTPFPHPGQGHPGQDGDRNKQNRSIAAPDVRRHHSAEL